MNVAPLSIEVSELERERERKKNEMSRQSLGVILIFLQLIITNYAKL